MSCVGGKVVILGLYQSTKNLILIYGNFNVLNIDLVSAVPPGPDHHTIVCPQAEAAHVGTTTVVISQPCYLGVESD